MTDQHFRQHSSTTDGPPDATSGEDDKEVAASTSEPEKHTADAASTCTPPETNNQRLVLSNEPVEEMQIQNKSSGVTRQATRKAAQTKPPMTKELHQPRLLQGSEDRLKDWTMHSLLRTMNQPVSKKRWNIRDGQKQSTKNTIDFQGQNLGHRGSSWGSTINNIQVDFQNKVGVRWKGWNFLS